MTQIANSSQVLERIGGDDGIRTRHTLNWPADSKALRARQPLIEAMKTAGFAAFCGEIAATFVPRTVDVFYKRDVKKKVLNCAFDVPM